MTHSPVIEIGGRAARHAPQGLGSSVTEQLVAAIEEHLPGQKGRAITLAVAAAGYADDPAALIGYYNDHREVLDGYLRRLDVRKAVSASGAGPKVDRAALQAGAGVVAGLAIGYFLFRS